MQTLRRDLGFAVRSLRNHPAFALTAALTLALGIGLTTAIFSVANTVLLRPLPYAHADRLVLVWGEMRARNVRDFPFAPGDLQDLRRGTTAFQDLAAVAPTFSQPLAGDGAEPEQVRVSGVTPNLLPLLGARVVLGRGFVAEDAAPDPNVPQDGTPPRPGAPRLPAIAVLTHGFWQRRYGGDPAVVGKTVDLGVNRARVVGVLAPGFELLWPPSGNVDAVPDVLTAMRVDYERASRLNVFLLPVGRLKPGVSVRTAHAQVERVAADLRERFPIMKTADSHFYVVPMHDDLVAHVRPAIAALLGAVAFVLLIACANVANLLLVRASGRTREMAVRAALGGSPWRLVRQMLAESVVLDAAGAAVGLALAYAGIRLLVSLAPENLPRLDAIGIDPIVLAFTVAISLAAAALFGTVPAMRAARPDLAEVLRASGRTPGLGGGKLLRSGVVIAEVALSFVLLIGCGLMVRSFVALNQVDPGFDSRGVLTFMATPRVESDTARAAIVRLLRQRFAGLPGVRSVTAASPLPLDGQNANARWGTEAALSDPSKFQQARIHAVLPGYFEAMRTKLLAGRTFTEADNRDSAMVVVVDRRLAAKAFPGQSAVGKRLLARPRTQEPEWVEIIGVVDRQRHESLADDGREAIYFTDGFFGHGVASRWAIRASGDPLRLVGAIRAAVAEVDPRLPIAEVQMMDALVDRAMAATRFALALIAAFAGIAAMLAAVGLYGVLSTTVRQRTAEIGVRMAFGAPSRSIFGLMIGEGLKLSGLGVALGLGAAYLLTRVMSSMLVGVEATDPLTFAAIVVLFFVIAATASWVPARRAAGLNPTVALREE
ncbi:MAG: ABC transporter permease [Gemmatimonadaceae bacterium]